MIINILLRSPENGEGLLQYFDTNIVYNDNFDLNIFQFNIDFGIFEFSALLRF